MHRADWLLLFIAAPPGDPVDPVRVQKGLFLLAMEGRLPPEERFAFEPYAYGPMSRDLYREGRRLLARGVLAERPSGVARWQTLTPTPAGARRAADLRLQAPQAEVATLDRIRGELATMTFEALLRDVYDRYPEYAARSVFRRP